MNAKTDPSLNPDELDRRWVDAVVPWVDRFCKVWYRQEVRGLERLPAGASLVVGNHTAGVSMWELLGFGARMYRKTGTQEAWHGLTHDMLVDTPGLGHVLRKLGSVRASHEGAAAVFSRGRKVLVCPGGNKEAFRPYSERNEVQFFGRKGWIRLALRHGVPITPVVFYGGHASFRVLHSGYGFAKVSGVKRWLRSDAFPVTLSFPWGLSVGPLPHIPLPVKVVTEVLEPVSLEPYLSADLTDEERLEAIYKDVTGHMQAALTRLASEQEDS